MIASVIMALTSAVARQSPVSKIVGHIKDAETLEPIANVNVFLSKTMIGTSSATDGAFTLSRVPVGVYELVASHVGYEAHIMAIRVLRHDSIHVEITLTPRLVQTRASEVIAESPKEWLEYLHLFVKSFIGETQNGEHCQILNPHVLNFTFHNDTLLASSDSVLQIENLALGFRIEALLDQFVWDERLNVGHYLTNTLFQQLQPSNANEFATWQDNRKKSYIGSLKHFLHTIYLGGTDDESFSIYSGAPQDLEAGGGHRISPVELIVTVDRNSPFKMLFFDGHLRVEGSTRTLERIGMEWVEKPTDVSFIFLKEPYALLDSAGNLLNPLSLEVSGAWAKSRVADLLPMH